MMTIYFKEIAGFFKSPLFYLLAFLTSLILGITFAMGLQSFIMLQSNAMYQFGMSASQLNAHYSIFMQHLSFLNLIFIFFTPALAMKLIAEERKNRTMDLLLTSPVTSLEIIASKYLSILTVVLALVVLALSYIAISNQMIEFNWRPTLITAFGIFIVGAVYSAISLFASSLTENTMMAFILGVIFNLGIWIFGGVSELIDQELWKRFFEQVSLNLHFQSLMEGVIKLNSVVFFLSVIVFFCFLAERLIESSRWRSL